MFLLVVYLFLFLFIFIYIQWIEYTTRMQYWLEEPKLRYASVGLVVIKLAD